MRNLGYWVRFANRTYNFACTPSTVANLVRTLGKSVGTNILVHLSWGKFDRDSRKMCQNSTYVVYAHSLWANLIVMSMETKLYFETELLEASLKQGKREKVWLSFHYRISIFRFWPKIMEHYDSLIISELDYPEELMNNLVWHYTCRPAERPPTLSWRHAPFLMLSFYVLT